MLDRVKGITRQIDELRMEAERSERAGDLARVAEIRYGLLPELERELSERAEPAEEVAREGGFGDGDTIRAHAELGEIRFAADGAVPDGEPEPAEPVGVER